MAKKVTERVIEIDAKGAENSIRSLREEVRKLTEVQKLLDEILAEPVEEAEGPSMAELEEGAPIRWEEK